MSKNYCTVPDTKKRRNTSTQYIKLQYQFQTKITLSFENQLTSTCTYENVNLIVKIKSLACTSQMVLTIFV